MKTLEQIKSDGFELVEVRGQRRVLHDAKTFRIFLTSGVDGFGQATGAIKVVLLVKDQKHEWKVVDSRPIATVMEFVSGVRSVTFRDRALCRMAKTADINAAKEELLASMTA